MAGERSLVGDLCRSIGGMASSALVIDPSSPFMDVPCHWHQDDAYYVKHSQSQTRMSVWVPLQDAHEQNGCLWIVPGSPQWGVTCRKGGCATITRPTDIGATPRSRSACTNFSGGGSARVFSSRLAGR